MPRPASPETPSNNDAPISGPDPWDPWADGQPRLRLGSFTAKQLSYLSSEAVHLESRRLFIGDFPHDWVEQNCRAWMASVHKAMDKTDASDGGHANKEFQADVLPAHDEGSKNPFSDSLPQLPTTRESSPTHRSLPARTEHSTSSTRARQEQEMVADITEATKVNEQHLVAQRKSIAEKRRRLRSRFRHKSLREAPIEVVHESRAKPSSSDHSTASSATSSDRTRVSAQEDAASTNTAVAESLSSAQTIYHDCREDLATDKTAGGRRSNRAARKPLVSIADPPVASIHAHTEDDTVVGNLEDNDEVPAKQNWPVVSDDLTETELTAQQGLPETPDKQSINSVVRKRKLANLKRRAHVRFSNHRQRQLVYQGRYLVEVRESTSAKPVVSETDAPLATTLVSRWKEYAVFAKYTGNVQRPLSLYFYDAVKDTKLTRRSKRAWSRSLDFKITLDPYYELKIFSPLDLTMAVWRPHMRTERDRERKRKTKIIILHAQSISSIWDISFLLGSVVQGADARQSDCRLITVGVPSIDVDVQLTISGRAGNQGDIDDRNDDRLNTLSYEELKQPLVATSPTLKLIVNKVWDAVRSLPRRYNVSSAEGCSKFALAWQQGTHSHRQLWVPSTSDEMTFMSRLFWLMQPCGNLSLIMPEPKCYEGDLVEPPGIEGYCMAVSAGGRYGKSLVFTGKHGQQYLCTHDYMLIYVSGARSQPPMLASGQSSLDKTIDPYPLDNNGDIKWIAESTCLREIDYHDAIARLELKRRIDMVSHSRGFIDLRYTDNIVADNSVAGQLLVREGGNCHYKLQFASQAAARSWEKHLNDVVTYWRAVHSAELLRRVAGNNKPMSITPYVANRTVLYSGPLFFKKHRFTTFKRFPVILTLQGMVVYRVDESTRQTADPNSPTPVAAYDFRHYATYGLEDSYIYTGQLARHALLDDDKHIDPNNPGVRALPRAYEDSWVSQDTELDRCFVIWRPRASRLQRVLRTTGTGSYLTFLARDKHERDHWVTAIRYVQSELASKTKEEVVSEEFNDTNLVDMTLSNKK